MGSGSTAISATMETRNQMLFEHDDRSRLDRLNLVNDTYAVLCKYLPQYEARGFNAHSRAQNIPEKVGEEFDRWVKQNTYRSVDGGSPSDDS